MAACSAAYSAACCAACSAACLAVCSAACLAVCSNTYWSHVVPHVAVCWAACWAQVGPHVGPYAGPHGGSQFGPHVGPGSLVCPVASGQFELELCSVMKTAEEGLEERRLESSTGEEEMVKII